jgi:hypothetical protein
VPCSPLIGVVLETGPGAPWGRPRTPGGKGDRRTIANGDLR